MRIHRPGAPRHIYKYNAKPGVSALALLLGALLAACAGAPPEPRPEPVAEPAPPAEPAPQPELAPRAPERYVVKKGDTLWDISSMFLEDPWLWPEIWFVNPQIENPHLIYPGDIITIIWRDGRRYLQIERDGQVVQTTLPGVQLEPRVRTTPLAQAIPTIPLEAIRPFLDQTYVVSEDELEQAPYVLRSVDGRLMSGDNNRVYVRGIDDPQVVRYAVVRVGEEYEDPETGDTLGYEALYLGEGEVVQGGDPATMLLTKSKREIQAGSHLIPAAGGEFNRNFRPRAPRHEVNGRIISVVDGVAQIGQYMVVVINRGARDGMEPGHALAIYQRGREIEDEYGPGLFDESVRLPDQRAGLLMVFRTFDRVSYGLVMHSTSEIHVGDIVRNP